MLHQHLVGAAHGRGVIAVAYGWALERAGHEVEFYVRPGRSAQYGGTIDLDLLLYGGERIDEDFLCHLHLIGHFTAVDRAQRRDRRAFVGRAARGKQVRNRDGGDDADDRHDDQQLDERETLLITNLHCVCSLENRMAPGCWVDLLPAG